MCIYNKASLSRETFFLSQNDKRRFCVPALLYIYVCVYLCVCFCVRARDNKIAKPQKLETKSAERIGLSARVSLL